MNLESLLSRNASDLEDARILCHTACQWPSKAARANLAAVEDDSHSNLGWDDALGAFVGRALGAESQTQVGFSFRHLSMLWIVNGVAEDQLALEDITDSDVESWLDARLADADLSATRDTQMPYEISAVRDYSRSRQLASRITLLGDWYALANASLNNLVEAFRGSSVSPPMVRCWPHHFDLATLFLLERGDAETAKSVGVGLSPGDGSFAEPYFYCSPWPVSGEPTPADLPPAPGPFTWHTEGFVSLVLPVSGIGKDADLDMLLRSAFSAARDVAGGPRD